MFYAFIETFCRKWEGEILPKLFFTFKQLEKCKNEYYPESLLNHVAKRADVPTCCACQCACVPAWFTCQRACVQCAKSTTSHIYVPTCHTTCQFFDLAFQRA